ncbi:hypothetical protein [Methylovulum psychrotolerans]|uniref:Uncharacterized protein n=1 Tax=Methylovulum psychrotolerans TaxID=1704499 RepID=A0A2S5CGF4_9GAMM|nr:hypothetical protein [Methylovulum psychrotolerans]POZ49890.1 hypothetical protein AADEFJLK_04336 [Methylovulum psychrotolerans]
MTALVSCRTCRHFTADPIGDGDGIGHCQKLEAYLKTNPTPQKINLALIALGNLPPDRVIWGGTLNHPTRQCQKYELNPA